MDISIPEMYTDGINIAGVVPRISFRVLVVDGDNNKTWHYFGVTAAGKPPQGTNADAPVIEHPYVQFPNDMLSIGEDMNDELYTLSLQVGLRREGVI